MNSLLGRGNHKGKRLEMNEKLMTGEIKKWISKAGQQSEENSEIWDWLVNRY